MPPTGTCRSRTHCGDTYPSGDVTPNREDAEVEEKLVHASRFFGIAVLDHIVWSRNGGLHAVRESHPQLFSRD